MSMSAAQAFLDRVEDDDALTTSLEALRGDPAAIQHALRQAGFDAEPEEIKVAFLARYGSELSPEQLETIAAGFDTEGAMIGAFAGVGLVAAAAAAAVG